MFLALLTQVPPKGIGAFSVLIRRRAEVVPSAEKGLTAAGLQLESMGLQAGGPYKLVNPRNQDDGTCPSCPLATPCILGGGVGADAVAAAGGAREGGLLRQPPDGAGVRDEREVPARVRRDGGGGHEKPSSPISDIARGARLQVSGAGAPAAVPGAAAPPAGRLVLELVQAK
ncbi:unnamed protein product [Prorocentrum cordatum]|uniref:Uncharacterized protein n=1 Tax=Prorocentrum cordatum TaxID=2364126 RepID=A0ABN9U7I4_9DINO|nr:unnamed protein product [Polarella glacialis]